MVSFSDDLPNPANSVASSVVTLGGGFLLSATPLGKGISQTYEKLSNS